MFCFTNVKISGERLQDQWSSGIKFVELESQMLHAKFQNHRTSGSGEEDF